MKRITAKVLEAQIKALNKLTGNPVTPYLKNEDTGQFEPQAHAFMLGQAYGGYELQQMCATGTGCSAPLNTGHIPARELSGLIQAMLTTLHLKLGATA
tara:strand:+ start:350 stop:643 length:294 start_codon:yes stop_codon:yes gene_type:complete